MRALKRFLFLASLVTMTHAWASTSTSEITDMWWNPAESGWGVNLVLQNNVAFLTFFIYDANRNPVWYTSDIHYQGNFVWTGTLYATNGPWFGGPFPSSTVAQRQAGTARFALVSLNQATLTYTVDGVSVSKSLQRQTWTNENYAGNYAGGFSIRATACNPSYLNGLQEQVGLISISQNGANFTATLTATSACSFAGSYSQAGKLGEVVGNYSCNDGTQGSFDLFELTPTISGFTGRVVGRNQYCQWSGYLGGIVRAQ